MSRKTVENEVSETINRDRIKCLTGDGKKIVRSRARNKDEKE